MELYVCFEFAVGEFSIKLHGKSYEQGHYLCHL